MSYCRWSIDTSDVYVYADTYGGWTCHVAKVRRIVGEDFPKIPHLPIGGTPEEWEQWATDYGKVWEARQAYLDNQDEKMTLNLAEIYPKFGGETFRTPTAGEMADLLDEMSATGIRVPEGVATVLREEDAE